MALTADLGRLRDDRDPMPGLVMRCASAPIPISHPDTPWASGASDQLIFILCHHRLMVRINHGTDFRIDLLVLSHVIAMAIVAWHSRCPSNTVSSGSPKRPLSQSVREIS